MQVYTELVPPHVLGTRLEQLRDPATVLGQKKSLRLGGYVRVSTRKEEQRSSIENQKKLLEEWAKLNGHTIVRHYVDVKTGAYSKTRTEIEELRRDARAGIIEGVVTKEIARTSRDVLDLLELKRELASYGACFISIKEGYDSRTDEDEFFLVLHGGFAQKERRATATRVKLTQLMKAREGLTNVALPAFGYRRGASGRLEPDPILAAVYREMVAKYLSGWGQARIAHWLNTIGIPPKRGRRWYPSSVKTILRNPVYLGVTIYNATALVRDQFTGVPRRVVRPRQEWVIREGTHQPLIDPSEWELLQQTLQLRSRPHWRYLGSGILRCSACGHRLFGSGARQRYYCGNRDCCSPRRSWEMDRCDSLLLELFKRVACKPDEIYSAVVRCAGTAEGCALAAVASAVADLIAGVERLDLQLQRLLVGHVFEAVYIDQGYNLRWVLNGSSEVAPGSRAGP